VDVGDRDHHALCRLAPAVLDVGPHAGAPIDSTDTGLVIAMLVLVARRRGTAFRDAAQ
jgi:hypothetical protein